MGGGFALAGGLARGLQGVGGFGVWRHGVGLVER